jgi:hypothetical protein
MTSQIHGGRPHLHLVHALVPGLDNYLCGPQRVKCDDIVAVDLREEIVARSRVGRVVVMVVVVVSVVLVVAIRHYCEFE